MTASADVAKTKHPTAGMRMELRAEATIEPDPVPTTPPTKKTQIIAIYGKGGIGKSFTLANLSYMMAQQGKRVLLIGCDPKSDTTSLLFGGRSCPTIIETSSKKKLAGEKVQIGDVCFKRDGVFAMELGGPEVGRGCGGRGIIHGFELLEKLGFHRMGLRLRAARFPRRCGLRRLRPADRARHVPESRSSSARTIFSRSTSPTTSARRSTTSASSAAMSASPAWSSTKTTAPARRTPSRRRSAFRSWRRSRPTTTFAAKARTTRSSASLAADGRRCLKSLPREVAAAPAGPAEPAVAGCAARPVQGRRGRPRRGARTGHDGGYVRRDASSKSRRSKSSMTGPDRADRMIDASRSPPRTIAEPQGLCRCATAAATRCCGSRGGRSQRNSRASAARLSARARTISRNRCARPLARCALGCGCGAPRRSFAGRLAAFTG